MKSYNNVADRQIGKKALQKYNDGSNNPDNIM